MYLTPSPTFHVMEVEDMFDDGFTILSHATTIWLSTWRYTGLPDTSLAWGFRLHQVQNRRRSVLKFDPSRVQSRRLHGDVVKFWVHKRGVGRSRCTANSWEGLLVNGCDEEAHPLATTTAARAAMRALRLMEILLLRPEVPKNPLPSRLKKAVILLPPSLRAFQHRFASLRRRWSSKLLITGCEFHRQEVFRSSDLPW